MGTILLVAPPCGAVVCAARAPSIRLSISLNPSRSNMVAVLLDGKSHSLELPSDCLSVAQATDYAKHALGAISTDACTPRSMQPPTMSRFDCESVGTLLKDMVSSWRLIGQMLSQES